MKIDDGINVGVQLIYFAEGRWAETTIQGNAIRSRGIMWSVGVHILDGCPNCLLFPTPCIPQFKAALNSSSVNLYSVSPFDPNGHLEAIYFFWLIGFPSPQLEDKMGFLVIPIILGVVFGALKWILGRKSNLRSAIIPLKDQTLIFGFFHPYWYNTISWFEILLARKLTRMLKSSPAMLEGEGNGSYGRPFAARSRNTHCPHV
jgi:hypothetical protein